MCGRFTLTADPAVLQTQFDLDSLPTVQPRYNIAPTQPVAVIANDDPRRLDHMSWGLVPSWAKDPSMGAKLINARSETAHEKPSFKQALRRRRCLIPANGFYEWAAKGQPPVYIHMAEHALFAMAGLWETWHGPDGETLRSCTILTTETNALVGKYHHRMAVILPKAHYAAWLSREELPPPILQQMLRPYPDADMRVYTVSTLVNNVRNDSPDCIVPYASPQQPTLL